MGIRFERDSRRATNGPMIFFSIIKDETFSEEIRNAFYSGLSFYAYRYPGDHMFSFGSSEGYVEGLGTAGFAIGMFSPSKPFITIPYAGVKKEEFPVSLYSMPSSSTSYEDYSNEVESIVSDIKNGKCEKVVAARVIVKDEVLDIPEKFYELCLRFPDAFVFCFGTPATGCWIGASPELLLEGKETRLSTMALAGTRRKDLKNSISEKWDEKNLEEQQIVTDYISDIFSRHNLTPAIGEPFTRPTGSIEHICTMISASFGTRNKLEYDLDALLRDLSPTPALCGSPKTFALEEISRLENFERGCYGGFCGPFHSLHDFRLNVVLRCASVAEKRWCIYTGGGITSRSCVESEWKETALKVSNTFGRLEDTLRQ